MFYLCHKYIWDKIKTYIDILCQIQEKSQKKENVITKSWRLSTKTATY